MNIHIIQNSVVCNTIVSSLEFARSAFPDAICIEATTGGIGWAWDGSTLSAPDTPPVVITIPRVVTMRQARLALLGAGLLDTVEIAIAGAGPAAKIEWEYAEEVYRGAGLVPQMATALGLTTAQIDALFVQAATL